MPDYPQGTRVHLVANYIDGNAQPAPEKLTELVKRIIKPFYRENADRFEIITSDESNSLKDILLRNP